MAVASAEETTEDKVEEASLTEKAKCKAVELCGLLLLQFAKDVENDRKVLDRSTTLAAADCR